MKKFTRVEPTAKHKIGWRVTVIKNFMDEDGRKFEFGTWAQEDSHNAAVIALTTDNKVITTYQFRPGPEKWMYELPGGGVKPGEDPKEAAARELTEETGYKANGVKQLTVAYRDAYMNGLWHYYLAKECQSLPAGPKYDDEERLQGAEVKLISIDQLIDSAKNGQMTDPVAVFMAYEELLNIKKGIK